MNPWFTAAEIREIVHEYALQPYGTKARWLKGRGVTERQLRRWRAAVYAGDVERGRVPRKESVMEIPPARQTSFEIARATERAAHEEEVARLQARIAELEGTNDVLGKLSGSCTR